MIPEKSVNRTSYDFNDEIQRVVAKFESCIDDDGRLRVIQQLRELSCPLSTAGVAPKAKVRTRGKPTLGGYGKKKKKIKKENNDLNKSKAEEDDTSTTRHPGGFEFVLTSEEVASV
ncbi:hypothetical protein Syun_006988 [Stephania yunnanensis]|uniref:Uncharacterized protein n=1 Tax=Stephania yunnanensis TaxID=152371 RepID=A0AAP0KXK2_9MAGN